MCVCVLPQISNTGLRAFPYPPDQPYSAVSEKLEESDTHSYPPVGVTVVLPESTIFMQEPQVARWDPVGNLTLKATEFSILTG